MEVKMMPTIKSCELDEAIKMQYGLDSTLLMFYSAKMIFNIIIIWNTIIKIPMRMSFALERKCM